jgi:hypothetical protein
VDQVGRDFQHDGPQLVRVVGLIQVEQAGRAHGEHRRGGPDPAAQRGVGAGQYAGERVEPVAEAREAFLARFHALNGGPVLLQETEHLAAGQHDPDVAVQQLPPGRLGHRLVLGPVQELVDLLEVVVGEAVDDVFLGLEVVVQRGFGYAQPFGDLAQRGLLIALLGKQLERHLLGPGPGIGARRSGPAGRAGGALAAAVVRHGGKLGRPRRPLVVHVAVIPSGLAVIYLTAG